MKNILGTFIKQRRLALNISGRRLAKEAGISSGYLSQIETGRFMPKPAVLLKLAKPLRLNYEVLLIKAGVLPEALAETGRSYETNAWADNIAIAGPRLTLPILAKVPTRKRRDALSGDLGGAPYLGNADFAVLAGDNSLKDTGVLKGDVVYIKKQSSARGGRLVLAATNDKIQLLTLKGGKAGAHSNNIEIIGVKVALLRR